MRDKSPRPETLDRVEAAMTAQGETPRAITARLPYTATSTVRHALAELVKQRRVGFDGPLGRRLYRRLTADRSAA